MDSSLLFNVSVIVLGSVSAGAFLGAIVSHWRSSRVLEALGPVGSSPTSVQKVRTSLALDSSGTELEKIKGATRLKLHSTTRGVVLNDKLFQAGLFTDEERHRFLVLKWSSILVCPLGFGALCYLAGPSHGVLGILMGVLAGFQIPEIVLRRARGRRSDDIMFYLPLVIEQLVIGVSSSLDIGPCIKWIVAMADERDSHNAVTELLRYAQQYVKSGVSLDEALAEIGRLSGHTELKHVFMSLARVTKHGGGITKQLQELANAVSSQREARIDGKIKKLELAATGPVGLVFIAFMATLFVSLGSQLLQIMK